MTKEAETKPVTVVAKYSAFSARTARFAVLVFFISFALACRLTSEPGNGDATSAAQSVPRPSLAALRKSYAEGLGAQAIRVGSSMASDVRGYMQTIATPADVLVADSTLILGVGELRNPAGPGAIWPCVFSVDLITKASTNCTQYASDTSSDASQHDAPSVMPASNGYVGTPYGANTVNTRPPAWACLTRSGGPGRRFWCQPFKYGNSVRSIVATSGCVGTLQPAHCEFFLPATGISELSCAADGTRTTACAGQVKQAVGDPLHVFAGDNAFLTFHPRKSGTDGFFDTACEQGGRIESYDPFTTQAQDNACNGMETVGHKPHDDAVGYFVLSDSSTGTIAPSITVNRITCSDSFAATGTVAGDAAKIVSDWNGGQFRGEGCGQSVAAAYRLGVITNDKFGFPQPINQDVAILKKNGDPLSDAAPDCAERFGSERCSMTDEHTLASGGATHFMWGGIRYLFNPKDHRSEWYYLVGVQSASGQWNNTHTQSTGGGAMACFRSNGPASGIWVWTDCAGNNPQTVSPALNNPTMKGGIGQTYGSGAGGTCTGGAVGRAGTCTEPDGPRKIPVFYFIRPPQAGSSYARNQARFFYDWGSSAQATMGGNGADNVPYVAASKDLTVDAKGNVWVVYLCKDTSNGVTQICYAELDGSTANTAATGFVDDRFGRSVGTQTVAITKSPGGNLIVSAGFGAGSSNPLCGGRSGTCVVEYRCAMSGLACTKVWRGRVLQQFSNACRGRSCGDTNGITCNIYHTNEGMHIYYVCTPGDQPSGLSDNYLFDRKPE